MKNPRLILDSSNPPSADKVSWRSPSNIAIVKYWGKFGQQLPRNPSLSFTLHTSCTDMVLEYAMKETPAPGISLDFSFHGEENEAFAAKMTKNLTDLLPYFPFLEQLDLTIQTGNSFPHSAGIASSASAMSALALCLCSLEDRFFGTLSEPGDFDQKASYIARLGSGSACRSIFPKVAVWGQFAGIPGSSDEYAVPFEDHVHDSFKSMHNDILIVSTDEKSVSSSAGHGLMEGNPYADARFLQARQRLSALLPALETGDWEVFGKIAEDEALTLHALMMTSNPSYLLMQPNTLTIIEKIRAFRRETKLPVYFTLDAGPNIHLLYPEDIISDVRGFMAEQLAEHCEKGWVLEDWVGEGPEEF